MNAEDKAWLMGVIFAGLGIAADMTGLIITALVAFLAAGWLARRDKADTEEDTDGR